MIVSCAVVAYAWLASEGLQTAAADVSRGRAKAMKLLAEGSSCMADCATGWTAGRPAARGK